MKIIRDGKEIELTYEEKIDKIKAILATANGIADNQEFGLSYSQAINYLDEIEEVLKG